MTDLDISPHAYVFNFYINDIVCQLKICVAISGLVYESGPFCKIPN